MKTCERAIVLEKCGIQIPSHFTDVLGSELKSTSINAVWLVVTKKSNSSFAGEQIVYDGTTYYLPEAQMHLLEIYPGDTVSLIFSTDLETIIIKR